MRTIATREVFFSASHHSLDCGAYVHGHDWFLRVEVEGMATPKGLEFAHHPEIAGLALELHMRDLNTMVIGAFPTPEGISAWALERLRLSLPGLRSVTVGYLGYSATTEV